MQDDKNKKEKRKRLTLENRKLIEEHLKNGVRPNSIAELLGFCSSTISREVNKNGGVRNYSAEKAHQTYLNLLTRISEQMSKTGKKKQENTDSRREIPSDILDRISSLEMQIEILYDTIKEIKKNTGI